MGNTVEFDIAVVGAGSAGLMTAQLLAEKNRSVALIDSKKDLLDLPFLTLGSFIDIHKYGLSEKVIASRIHKGTFYSRYFSTSKIGRNVYTVDKTQLHRELLEKCKQNGVHLFPDSRIAEVVRDESGAIERLINKRGESYQARLYVDATGTSGFLSRKFGLQAETFPLAVGLEYNVHYTGDPHETVFFVGSEYAGGYGWIFPLGHERAIVGFGSFNPQIRNHLKKGLQAIVEDKRVCSCIRVDNTTTYGGNLPITGVITRFHTQNLVCVGDSVSQVNPIVGEGYKFILDAAIMAAEAIHSALSSNDLSRLEDYESAWKATFKSDYVNSKLMQTILANAHKSDWLADLGVLFLKYKRSQTVYKIISGQFSKLDLLLP